MHAHQPLATAETPVIRPAIVRIGLVSNRCAFLLATLRHRVEFISRRIGAPKHDRLNASRRRSLQAQRIDRRLRRMHHIPIGVARTVRQPAAGRRPQAQLTRLQRGIVHFIGGARAQHGRSARSQTGERLPAIGGIGKLAGRRANVTTGALRRIAGRLI